MRTILICFGEVDARRRRTKRGENLATLLVVDVAKVLAACPTAWFSLLVRRPDRVVYPAAPVLNADADGCVRYAVTNVETALPGEVEIEVQARDGDVLIKSHTFAIEVLQDLSESGSTPGPSPPEPAWSDKVIEAALISGENADRMETALKEAEELIASFASELVPGALVVARSDNTVGSLAKGQPGQVLSTDEDGALVWVSVAPGTVGEIPVATGALLGLVRSSEPTLPDSVAVNADGKMTVNSLNVNKLYVAQQDEWVLNAGGAEPV